MISQTILRVLFYKGTIYLFYIMTYDQLLFFGVSNG